MKHIIKIAFTIFFSVVVTQPSLAADINKADLEYLDTHALFFFHSPNGSFAEVSSNPKGVKLCRMSSSATPGTLAIVVVRRDARNKVLSAECKQVDSASGVRLLQKAKVVN